MTKDERDMHVSYVTTIYDTVHHSILQEKLEKSETNTEDQL